MTQPEPEWFGFRLTFLSESDQDTVSLILNRGIKGINLQLVTKDGQVRDVRLEEGNAGFDEEKFTATGGDGAAASFMTFRLIDDEGELTGEPFFVRYSDIESIGVY